MNRQIKRFPALLVLLFVALMAMAGQAWGLGGPIVMSGDDADDGGHCQGSSCGQLYGKALNFIVSNSQSTGTGIVAIGVNSSNALTALNSWNNPANGGPGVAITHARTTAEIAGVNFSDFAMIYIPSDSRNTGGGINDTQLTALNARQADIADFVNNQGGGLLALTEAGWSHRYGWLPIPLEEANIGHSALDVISPTPEMDVITPGLTPSQLSHCCFHTAFTGPAGFSGLKVLAYHDHNGNGEFDGRSVDHVIILGGVQVTIQGSISLDPPNATLPVGDQHTVTATAEDGDPLAPVAGATVTFTVGGANAGASGTCNNAGCTTDANGQVSFTYTGTNEGTDNIAASFVDGNGAQQTSNTVNATWEAPDDTEPPVITAPANITACNDPGQASAVVGFAAATATDNVGVVSLTQTAGPPSGSAFPIGTTVITWTATDAAGNTASASMTVTVTDCEAPVVTTSDITVEATGPTTPVDVGAVTSATDNVGVTSGPTASTLGPFPVGSTTVTWTACDAAGNCGNATQTVTVTDTTPPVITAPANITECNDPGQATAVVDFAAATATDNSGSATVTQTSGPLSGTPFPLGTTVITWTATDGSGNTATASMTITVNDCEAPVVTTSDITVEATGPTTPVNVSAVTSATDNVGVTSGPTASTLGPFPVGSTTVTWTACDAAGNCGNATQTVTVTDTTAPDISNACEGVLWPPNHKLVNAVSGSASDAVGPVTVTVDVASNQPLNGTGDGNTDSDWMTVVNPDGSYSVKLRAERAGNDGQRDYTVTITATDGNDNTSTETCTVSVPHDQGNNNSPSSKKGKK